jgi:hypothetical protein
MGVLSAGTQAGLFATKPGAARRPSRAFPTGRVCASEGCGARLSIYNGESRCWIQKSAHPHRIGVGGRKRQDTTRQGR